MPEILAVVYIVVSQITAAVQTLMTYTIDIDVDKQFQHKICTLLKYSIQLNILSLMLDTLSLTLPNLATCDY